MPSPVPRTTRPLRPPTVAAFACLFALASLATSGEGLFIVNQPWVQPASAGRDTAAYMDLTATAGARVIDASSVAARSTRVRGRSGTRIELPAGTLVALAPGGQRLELKGLLHTLRLHDRVPISLEVVYADGTRQTISVDAEVRMKSPLQEEMEHGHAGHTHPH